MPAHTVFPFLNENNKYNYVDADFNTVIAGEYKRASLFTATGFAVVMNDSFQSAVIDKKGALLIPFGAYEIDLAVVNGITLFRKTLDYNNPLRFWNWSYSLFSGLNKAVMRSKIEIGVLETKQRLLFKRMMANAYPKPSLSPITVDEQHFLLNDCLYRIKDQKIRKLKNNIIRITGHSTLLKKYKGVYSLFSLSGKRIIKEDFVPVDNWHFNTKHETILLEGLNEYVKRNTFPKILKGKKSGKIYSYPDFDKTLPAEISGANEITIEQIKKVSIIVSVPQSIYFLLGYRVNETNRYDWLVIDQHGNLLPDLPVENFYITSQLGEILWPDKMSLLPDTFLNEGWKLKKLSKINGSGKHFIAHIKAGKNTCMGVWDQSDQRWIIPAVHNNILVLDQEKGIYAIEQVKNSGYQLYNSTQKVYISHKKYHTISSRGYVSRKDNSGNIVYFFIDIYSGKEFI
jgi:hypothetical protein